MNSKLTFSILLFSFFNASFYPLSSLGSFGLLLQYLLLAFALYAARRLRVFPALFFLLLSIILIFISPPDFELVQLLPLLGFFISGPLRLSINSRNPKAFSDSFIQILPFFSILIAAFSLLFIESAIASKNFLSILLLYTSIYMYSLGMFSRKIQIYIVLTAIILFTVFKNRSSIFFLILSPVPALYSLSLIGVILALTFITYFGLTLLETTSLPIFQKGGFLWFLPDTRFFYLFDYLSSDCSPLCYDSNDFLIVPTTGSGFPDFHNSFLTNLNRDGYFSIFKFSLFSLISLRWLPKRLTLVIFLRAFFDTFLLGSIYDIVLWSTLISSAASRRK